PQLPLEAVMAADGAFRGVPTEAAAELMYVQLSGGREPGIAKPLGFKIGLDELIDNTLTGINRLITQYANPEQAYLSQPRPQFENKFGDYDHLARVAEWRGAGASEDEA
ncbi:MAG: double-strand break repair protein AddB, partial [Rhodospirillales bacterium]